MTRRSSGEDESCVALPELINPGDVSRAAKRLVGEGPLREISACESFRSAEREDSGIPGQGGLELVMDSEGEGRGVEPADTALATLHLLIGDRKDSASARAIEVVARGESPGPRDTSIRASDPERSAAINFPHGVIVVKRPKEEARSRLLKAGRERSVAATSKGPCERSPPSPQFRAASRLAIPSVEPSLEMNSRNFKKTFTLKQM